MIAPSDLKAVRNRAHAGRRAAERYGLDLDRAALDRLEAMIRCCGPDVRQLGVGSRSRTRPLYAVRWDGAWIPVLYDTLTDSVVTVLSESALDPYRDVIDPVPVPEPVTVRVAGPKSRPKPKPKAKAVPPDLPEAPDVPEGATLAEYDAAMAAVVARQTAVSTQSGRWVQVELLRLGQLRRSLRARRHVAYTRGEAVGRGDDPDDHLAVMARAYAAFGSLGRRLGWDALTEEEHAARKVLECYLESHRPASSP